MKTPRLTVFPIAAVIFAYLATTACASPAVQRRSRSIWPFGGSSNTEETSAMPEAPEISYDAAIAQGILKVDPNDRRIWKIHKYQGFDLRPIDMVPAQDVANSFVGTANSNAAYPPHSETSASGYPINQSSDSEFPSSVNGSPPDYLAPQQDNREATTEEVDLSFLDDLGGLAWFLPDPKDENGSPEESKIQIDSEASKPIEDNKPGFFSSLLSALTFGTFGASSSPVKGNPPETQTNEPTAGFVGADGSESSYQVPTYHLPETKGSYVAYRLPTNGQTEVDDSSSSGGLTQVNNYSEDTQPTSFAWNGETAKLPVVANQPEVHNEQSPGYQSLNPRGYQGGAPIEALVEEPVTAIDNSPTPRPTGTANEEDYTSIVKPSDYSSLVLSSVLPYREPVDFGKYGSMSERRVSEDVAPKEEVDQIPEESDEKTIGEATTPAVLVVEPSVNVATTYSKIRSYGSPILSR